MTYHLDQNILEFTTLLMGLHGFCMKQVERSNITSRLFQLSIGTSPKKFCQPINSPLQEYFSPMTDFVRTWPAVYFLYDLSPITVAIKEERRSFIHFITRLCAILGGTFALTGMLDRWMYRLLEALTKPNPRSGLL
uniref:Endoplasmic reticulum vesicle transporter C-terminal domain-containing protein n=1 Tax=Salix viminalis TaxID=40686 RepID=A0A6N2KY47_SALVM